LIGDPNDLPRNLVILQSLTKQDQTRNVSHNLRVVILR
jgi:hypothetical protein